MTAKKPPPIVTGRVYRYRQRGTVGVMTVNELVHKANGWWVIGYDKKRGRGVEVQPGGVFPRSMSPILVPDAPVNKWK